MIKKYIKHQLGHIRFDLLLPPTQQLARTQSVWVQSIFCKTRLFLIHVMTILSTITGRLQNIA